MPTSPSRRPFRGHTVTQASTLLAVTALLSNVLGLGRNLIFYRLVGLSQLDVYFASFRIADLIFNLLIFGAITSAVIPIATQLVQQQREEEARQVVNQFLSWGSLCLGTVIVILYLAMPSLMARVVAGFDPAKLALTVRLSRLMLLQTVFFTWSYIIGALLNAYRRFTTYAYAPLVYTTSIIVGGLLAPRFGIIAMTGSVVVGALLHFLIQYIEVRHTGFRPRLDLGFGPHLRQIVVLMVPRSLSQGMVQLVLLTYTGLVSGMAGAIAIFSGMNDIQTTPTVVVANSLASASFPAMAAQISQGDKEGLSSLLTKMLRLNLFLLLPSLALGLALRSQVVRLVIGLGSASWQQTEVAIATFSWFMLGIVPASLVVLLARLFYAHRNTLTSMWIVISTSLLGMAVAALGILVFHGNVSMLALAETTISSSQCLLYFWLLRRGRLVDLPFGYLADRTVTYGIGSALAGLAAWGTLRLVNAAYLASGVLGTQRVGGLLLQTAIAALVGGLTYLSYSRLRSKEELQWTRQRGLSRLP